MAIERALLAAILLFSSAAFAGNELRDVRLTSCRPESCAKLSTDKLSRSVLQPNIMAFGAARLSIVNLVKDALKPAAEFEGSDGYYDLAAQVIVLRNLKRSAHRDLIYDLNDGKVVYF